MLYEVITELPETVSQEELLSLVQELNEKKDVNGILVQLPLPRHIDEDKVIMTISPEKDVDGFHPQNVGNLSIGRKGFVSCTPAGIIQLLKRSGITIEGKECVIVGRSNIVGKPMAMLLIQENGTVTVSHSRTKDFVITSYSIHYTKLYEKETEAEKWLEEQMDQLIEFYKKEIDVSYNFV